MIIKRKIDNLPSWEEQEKERKGLLFREAEKREKALKNLYYDLQESEK